MAKLDLEADSPGQVLDQVRYRVEWDRVQEARKRREEEAVERERVSYAQIDWHDFVVVETVDYQPWEQGQFPPPTNPTQVGQRVLMQVTWTLTCCVCLEKCAWCLVSELPLFWYVSVRQGLALCD